MDTVHKLTGKPLHERGRPHVDCRYCSERTPNLQRATCVRCIRIEAIAAVRPSILRKILAAVDPLGESPKGDTGPEVAER